MDHVRVERDVVVAEEEEGGAFDHSQRLVTGGSVARLPGKHPHERFGEKPAHTHRRVEFVVGDQDED